MDHRLWDRKTNTVYGESCLFFTGRSCRLLYRAERILRVYSPAAGITYEEGKDYIFSPESNSITLTETSSIFSFPPSVLTPDKETAVLYPAPGANAIAGGANGSLLFFDEKELFARKRIEVDYLAAPETEFLTAPEMEKGSLPRFTKLLREKRNCNIILIGDSISFGSNASKTVNVPPYAPPYIDLFVEELQNLSGAEITFLNHAISGTGCREASAIEEKWLAPPCDLLLVAYGTNDFARMDELEFRKTVAAIAEKKRSLHPETEVLFLSFLESNPLRVRSCPEKAGRFAEELRKLAAEGEYYAYADIYTFWRKIAEKKDFYDLTGNGVNHPNDYGYRIYLYVLLSLFRGIFSSE